MEMLAAPLLVEEGLEKSDSKEGRIAAVHPLVEVMEFSFLWLHRVEEAVDDPTSVCWEWSRLLADRTVKTKKTLMN